MITYKELFEKVSFSTSSNPKKMDDDTLMDFIGWLENMKDPAESNKDQFKKIMKVAKAEMKKRGFSGK